MIKCTHEALGCTGKCSAEFQESIRNRINQCGGAIDQIYPAKGFCWLTVMPHDQVDEIIERCAFIDALIFKIVAKNDDRFLI